MTTTTDPNNIPVLQKIGAWLSGTEPTFTVYEDDIKDLDGEGVTYFNSALNAMRNQQLAEFTLTTDARGYILTRTVDAKQFENVEAAAQRVTDEPLSVFRPRYRKLNDDELAKMDLIKQRAQELWDAFDAVGPSREVSIGKTELETAVMWAIKGLTK